MELNDKIALITGSGSGIGRATAILFALSGAKVIAVDKSIAAARDTGEQIQNAGGTALPIGTDVTSKSEVAEMLVESLNAWGRIDILVNNVGGANGNDLLEMDEEQWDRDIELNLNTTARVTKATVPQMIKQANGSVVNIASVNGLAGYDLMAYGAAKAGVINLTQNMALSYGCHGIRFNSICPGTINTAAWSERLRTHPDTFSRLGEWYPLGRVGEPEDVARAALFFASEASSWITGQSLAVDGGLTAVSNAYSNCEQRSYRRPLARALHDI